MPSKTDIANRALRSVGERRITSFSEDSPRARVVADIYDELLVDLMRFPWNFATKRVKLAQIVGAPVFEFDFAYALPSDWVYTVSIHNNDAALGVVFYREELHAGQNAILSNWTEIWIRYVSLVTDPNLMSADFRNALTAALGRDLAIPLASSNSLFDRLSKKATLALAKARSTDAMGSSPERRPRGSWARVRSGWRTFGDHIA